MAKLVENNAALELKEIYKSFYQNQVLKGVSFSVDKGSILGLLGGNGAGKSTLMKIVNGVYRKDSGEIFVNGKEAEIRTAQDARKNGIAMVYQELSLIPTMTVVQNLFLNAEPHKGFSIDEKECIRRADKAFADFGIEDIDPHAVVGDLPIGKQQLVEIIKAMLKDPHVLILDEPTSGLDPESAQNVNRMIQLLAKNEGITVFLCTHQLRYAQEICTRYGLIEEGKLLASGTLEELRAKILTRITLCIRATKVPDMLSFKKIGDQQYELDICSENEIPGIVRQIIESNGDIYAVSAKKPTLEDIYFALTSNAKEDLK